MSHATVATRSFVRRSVDGLADELFSHESDSDIHVSPADRSRWDSGVTGPAGPAGKSGVHLGSDEPDSSDLVWVCDSSDDDTPVLRVRSAPGGDWKAISQIRGDTGQQGEQGLQGEQGIQGVQGEKGETGDVGATGPQGPQGSSGVHLGPDEPGEANVWVYYESSDSSDDSGLSDVPVLRIRGSFGTWYPISQIRGEKGEQGLPGSPGEPGATGPQGEKGEQGERGEKGEQGVQGPTGPAGASPIIHLKRTSTGAHIVVDNPDSVSDESVDLYDGSDGAAGADAAAAYLVAQAVESDGSDSGYEIVDQGVNYWSARSSTEALDFPASHDGRARDFILSVTIPSSWASTTYTLTVPSGVTIKSYVSSPLSFVASPGSVYVFGFTEISPDMFMVTRKAML